jgi:glycerate kinase
MAADGGEGTLAVFEDLGWKAIPVEVSDPIRRRHTTYFMASPDGKKIAIELSRICGSRFLNGQKFPLISDTYGLGEAIVAAIERNPEEIIIGLGGSASNDLGLGIFQALDVLNTKGDDRGLKGLRGSLNLKVDMLAALQAKTNKINFTILHDTDAFLSGSSGALRIFGKQKGLNYIQRHFYDFRVARWVNKLEKKFAISLRDVPGLGAAGGVSAALYTLFKTTLISGPDYLLSLSGFNDAAVTTDLIITGEGRFDKSTLTGKFAMKVIEFGKANKIPVLVLCAHGEQDAIWQAQSISPHLKVIQLSEFSDSEFLSIAEIQKGITVGVHKYLGQLESIGIHI